MSQWKNTDDAVGKPKHANTDNSALYGNTYGVSTTEMATSVVKPAHAGWVTVKSYTDSNGNSRYKSEVLVAMSGITGDDTTGSANTFFAG